MADKNEKDMEFESHLANYRIAFDAMRAYHSSEIEHKKDMITILNGIFVSIITVYFGVFYFVLSNEFDIYNQVSIFVILIITTLYILLIVRLMIANKKKIVSDNGRYEQFRFECQAERKYLCLAKYHQKSGDDIYWNQEKEVNEDREGSGYLKTINLIDIYCINLILIISLLSFVSIILLLKEIYG